MLVAGAALFAALFALSERYVVGEGLGDDGSMFARWIREYSGDVRDLGLPPYLAQRVLVSVAIRHVHDALGIAFDAPSIVRSFQVLDWAAVTGAVACWNRSARHFDLTRARYLVATTSLFVSFGTLKWLPFDPVLTDALGFALGSAALALYLERRVLGLAALSMLGSFMWPSFSGMGVLLLAFPRPAASAEAPPLDRPSSIDEAVAGVTSVAVACGAASQRYFLPLFDVHQASQPLFEVSCVLLGLTTFFALRALVRTRMLADYLRQRDARSQLSRVLAVVVIVVSYAGTAYVTSRPERRVASYLNDYGFRSFLSLTLFLAAQRPLVFLVSHASFFGVGAVAVIVGWRDVCRVARRFGLGLSALLGATFVFALNSESRRLFALAPFVLPLGGVALGCVRWSATRLAAFALVALFAAKPWWDFVQEPTVDLGSIFFHVGPWMPHHALVIQGAAATALAAWLIVLRRRAR